MNQKVIVAQLRGLGYEADAVSSGKEAVESLAVRAYDVVLMDVHMPQMDGITATRAIRETPQRGQARADRGVGRRDA